VTVLGAVSLGHFKSQLVFELAQLREQEPVHTMWQVAPPVHETLPLDPTVRLQVEKPAQLALQDCPQLPEQLL